MQDAITEMLRDDMRGEHQAIVQYLRHAYALGETTMAFEIEAIAREEMRHLDWLADLIVGLGGDPTMERAPVDVTEAPVAQQMLKDVLLEEGGIAQYRAHMDAIENEQVRLVLSRITHDEEAHRAKFASLAEEAAGLPASPAPAGGPPKRLGSILNQGVRHEYTVTLQYLYHSFVSTDKDLAQEFQNVAINEMQHIGWLSEAVEGAGGEPDLNHTPLALTRDPEEMLEADIAAEREVTRDYTKQLEEIEDPKLQVLVERIRDHEIYHDATFTNLLEEVEATEQHDEPEPTTAPSIPSVGSLINE